MAAAPGHGLGLLAAGFVPGWGAAAAQAPGAALMSAPCGLPGPTPELLRAGLVLHVVDTIIS